MHFRSSLVAQRLVTNYQYTVRAPVCPVVAGSNPVKGINFERKRRMLRSIPWEAAAHLCEFVARHYCCDQLHHNTVTLKIDHVADKYDKILAECSNCPQILSFRVDKDSSL